MRCHDTLLKRLLDADESSAEYSSVASHVEGCSRCQQRLMQLSADDGFLVELREVLRAGVEIDPYRAPANSSVVISIEGGMDDSASADCEPVSLDFLGPASHPEMLGRIGRYDVERMIGSGGMGIVLKGFDTELHRVVAIKVLKPHLAHIGAARHRFAREAQSAAAVVHEHVIPIHDVQSDGQMPFLVMQYVPGQSLQSRVDERGPLDAKEALRIARQAAAGLAAAHAQGLVHRDVKPANILMEESVERVLISDFGLARTVDDATLTRTGIVAGTPHYMSPEQASGRSVDHRSDLFSLGSVMYFMLTGRPPFRAEHALAILNRICHDPHRPVDEVNPDVPAELADAIDRLLSKIPDDRFRNAHEAEQRLESILAQLQTGHRSSRLRWRRIWLRWRSTVQRTFVGLCAVTICILTGMELTRWQMASSIPSTNATSSSQPNKTDPDAFEARTSVVSDDRATREFLMNDTFYQDLSDVENSLSWIEEPDSTNSTDAGSSSGKWQYELDAIRALLETLEQGPHVQDQSQPSHSVEGSEP